MSSEKFFYVYEHIRPDTGEVFYVGKGLRKRASTIKRENPYHRNVVAKLARLGLVPEIRIVFESVDESEAFRAEEGRIAHWRSLGVALSNLTIGGEGVSGRTPEVIQKIRDANHRQFSDPDARKRASKNQKRNWEDPEYRLKRIEDGKRYYENPEARRHQSEMHGHQKKRVTCLDNGVVYESVIAAARAFGVTPGNITNVCSGVAHHTGGYHFEYTDPENRPQGRKRPILKKPVLCIDSGTIYESGTAAAKAFGVSAGTISGVCRGRYRTAVGHRFCYADPEKCPSEICAS